MARNKHQRDLVLEGIRAGIPRTGPLSVHIDVTNTCNARCVTCWDHSPSLHVPRSAAWKSRRLPRSVFDALVDQLAALGSVRAVVLSGMGEPLTHPDIYDMIARIKAEGWHLTLISNLVAAQPERLVASGVDQVLAGVQGVTPDSYTAFHPGWTEAQFFAMCRLLRELAGAGVRVRHVQVIDRHTAPEVVEMVRFGRRFRADRVNYKLASLAGGTEAVRITGEQRRWLLDEAIPEARALAAELGVPTNVDLFERQVEAGSEDAVATTPMDEIGCYMGYVYTRITVDQDVLYCCNTNVRVGSLRDAPFADLWTGEAWQALRDRIARHEWFEGCERCGKFEQNVKWATRASSSSP